ncbi:hypothetical protein ANACOL_03875 [Anaerotruncus colihominis DSM 17241]|uniref:Uncharacterized protein n=1 Tax=Anaerotruncus colihominis DSM 17241 TaxID=445972 RepID=B0PGE2_9FIRM|nr:hypothetical protein ANACOL_03875 [Anaerotruncus colihominis DSM 17241]
MRVLSFPEGSALNLGPQPSQKARPAGRKSLFRDAACPKQNP